MPDRRKPPLARAAAPRALLLPSDSDGFSIESTTMRLKSVRLRRAETREAGSRASRRRARKTRSNAARDDRPSGRVRHDERGVAVWDWAVATGEFATLSHDARPEEACDRRSQDRRHAQDARAHARERRPRPGWRLRSVQPARQSAGAQGEAATRQGITGSKEREARRARPAAAARRSSQVETRSGRAMVHAS